MTLISILIATLAAGIGSVWLAAALMRVGALQPAAGAMDRGPAGQHLLSLAAGALLATAFMHLLPEALEGGANAQWLFGTLLVGLVFFFLLDKAELWHHGHEHHHAMSWPCRCTRAPARAGRAAHVGGVAVLTGDSVHCFGDGILSLRVSSPLRLGRRRGGGGCA